MVVFDYVKSQLEYACVERYLKSLKKCKEKQPDLSNNTTCT